jgi:hypothetical protein
MQALKETVPDLRKTPVFWRKVQLFLVTRFTDCSGNSPTKVTKMEKTMFDRHENKSTASPEQAFSAAPEPAAAKAPELTSARIATMIGPSITIKGTVTGDEDPTTQGKVEGSIDLSEHEVSVGASGKVTADINARVIRIDGEVSGDVSGHEKGVISKSGNVRG